MELSPPKSGDRGTQVLLDLCPPRLTTVQPRRSTLDAPPRTPQEQADGPLVIRCTRRTPQQSTTRLGGQKVVKRRCPPLKGTPRCRPSPPRTPDAPLKRPAEVCWNSQTWPVPSLGNKRPAEVCWFSQPRPVLFKSKGKRGVSFGSFERTRPNAQAAASPKTAAAVANRTTRLLAAWTGARPVSGEGWG
uniref:Uncharacterized protein n=1 Tax=Sphaerodactylus townsendi TaxID=933632 RepID=A0ACB8E7T4_9SAUR